MKFIQNEEIETKMYIEFRSSIDRIIFPLLKEWAGDGYKEIIYKDKIVGFLMVIERYVECIYVLPEYRRLGLGKKAVQDYMSSGGEIEKLHIIKTNYIAKKFWENLFSLEEIETSPCDSLYLAHPK